MDGKRIIILRLEGPLQSWGASSKWDSRSTESFPTRSGVVGLIGSALGLERGDRELLSLNSAMTMAVRADRSGETVVDFQTVRAPGEERIPTAGGGKKPVGFTVVSKRSYLQDACFTVFLEVEEDWHERIVKALRSPKWSLYLGRKNCVPTRPVLENEEAVYSDIMDALFHYSPAERSVFPMPYETEIADDSLPSLTRSDDLVESPRGFIRRKIWKGLIKEIPICI